MPLKMFNKIPRHIPCLSNKQNLVKKKNIKKWFNSKSILQSKWIFARQLIEYWKWYYYFHLFSVSFESVLPYYIFIYILSTYQYV